MNITSIGRKHYKVEDRRFGHQWEFEFKGGFLSTERKALDAAEYLIDISTNCLVTAEIAKIALGSVQRYANNASIHEGLRKSIEIWNDHVKSLEDFAFAVPRYVRGFATGSDSIDLPYLEIVDQYAISTRKALVNIAPLRIEGDMSGFIRTWGHATLQCSDVGITMGRVQWLNKNSYTRADNVRAIKSKTADADSQLNAYAMRCVMEHVQDALPEPRNHVAQIEHTPQIVVRGDRARTVLNVMGPEIEAQIARLTDASERAAMQEWFDRLVAKVDKASPSADQPLIEDLRLKMETLEETIDSRLGSS